MEICEGLKTSNLKSEKPSLDHLRYAHVHVCLCTLHLKCFLLRMHVMELVQVNKPILCVCMSQNRCIVACAHLGNGTGHRTVTLAAPLLLTSGPVRYEAVLHSCGISLVGY